MPQTDLFWLKKIQKTLFMVKFPKSGKTPSEKFVFQSTQVGYYLGYETR
jgi:hypothetical protein